MSLLKMILLLRQAVGQGNQFVFLSPPTPPMFTDSVTITDAQLTTIAHYMLPANITVSGNLKRQVILSGNFPFLNFRGIRGDRGNPIVIKNDGTAVIGSSSLNQHALDMMASPDNSTHIEAYGLEVKTSSNASYSGVIINADLDNAVFRLFNFVADSIGYAGLLAQDQVNTRKYHRVMIAFWKIDGYVTDGEPFYFGYVTLTSASEFDRVILIHNRVINKGRDGAQFKKCNFFYMGNNTMKNVARYTALTGQDHAFQIEASIGIVENNIFDTVHRPWNVFAHQYTVENNVIFFDGQAAYIGDALSQPGFSGDPRLVGGTGLYKNNIIVWIGAGTLPYACEIEEKTGNITFDTNVWVGDITAMLFYHPASPTGVLTGNAFGDNGNVKQATISAALVYLSTNINSADFLKIAHQAAAFYTRQMGALVPLSIPKILDCKEVTDKQVPNGTSWATASATLPSTANFYLTDGTVVNLAVTWAQGSYTTSPGTYIVFGTPTLVGAITNPYSIKAEQYITVNNPPTVLISFGSAAAALIPGNWNNLRADNPSGVQTIKNGAGTTIPNLIDSDGSSTSWGINVHLLMSGSNTGKNPAGAGLYPDNAQINCWYNPGAAGNSRGFRVTGLNPAHTYKFRLLCSTDGSVGAGTHIVDLNVLGTARNDINITNNISTPQDFTAVPDNGGGSGNGTVLLIEDTGRDAISVLEITDLG